MKSFEEFVRLLSGRNTITMDSTTLVVFTVHAVHFNIWCRTKRWLLCNRYTQLGALPACCSDKQLQGEQNEEVIKMPVYGLTYLMTVT